MTRAYQEIYLNKAQRVLGEAFDYAVNACGIPGREFASLLAASSLGRRMEKGEPAVLAGKSGIELAADLVLETTGKTLETQPQETFVRSAEYWIGWALAYYQWYSDRRYSEIVRAIPYDDLQKMYGALHEADISKFAAIADERVRTVFKDTNLKRIRSSYGCTQAELAQRSGVALRSIQMYEQRRKHINRASAETLYRISKVLGCAIEDLIEK